MKAIVSRVKVDSGDFLYSIFVKRQPINLIIMKFLDQDLILPTTFPDDLELHKDREVLREVEVSEELVADALDFNNKLKRGCEIQAGDPDFNSHWFDYAKSARKLLSHLDEVQALLT